MVALTEWLPLTLEEADWCADLVDNINKDFPKSANVQTDPKRGARVVVSSKYYRYCKKYVQDNCNKKPVGNEVRH